MTDQYKKDIKDDFESKEGKIRRNGWRKLISIIIAGITLYLLNVYNVFDYTGIIIGLLLIVVWAVIINYVVDKIFSFFID